MGNKAALIPFVAVACLFIFAAFLFNPTPAAAASPASLAFSIIDLVNKRLCDRQDALHGRIMLISPSKCSTTPPPEDDEPTVTLTASPTTINAGQSATLTWSSTDATSCTAFQGWSGSKPTSGSAAVTPSVTTTYQLDCTGPGGVGSDDATVTVTVVTPTAPTVDITANPITITTGSSTTLTWTSTNATSCTASNGWSGSKAVSGTQSVTPGSTTTYTITCTGAGGSASDSVTVTVTAPPVAPTLTFTANPTTIQQGSASLLSWSTTNASSCTKSGGWSGATTTSGTLSVSPNATTTYSLSCTGAGGSVSQSATVNVILTPSAPTVDLVASRTTVNGGSASTATTTLSWTTTNATSCTASGGGFTGTKATISSELITPSATTTYQLNCTGAGGSASDSVTVNFVPAQSPSPTVILTANPVNVTPGAGSATSTLTWSSTNATSCTAFGGTFAGSRSTSGTEIVQPGATTTYQLDCTGPGGLGSDDAIVNFVPVSTEDNSVVINEIAWMGSMVNGATSTDAEWIELRNVGSASVDMNGWTLTFATTSIAAPDTITISSSCANTVIPSNGFYLLVRNSVATTTLPVDCVYPGGTATALSNTGEIVTLRNAEAIVSSVDGSNNWQIGGAPMKGNNMTKDTAQRADDGTWHTATPTPKAANN